MSTDTFNPSAGNLYLLEAGDNMMFALMNVESSTANFLLHGADLLKSLNVKELEVLEAIYNGTDVNKDNTNPNMHYGVNSTQGDFHLTFAVGVTYDAAMKTYTLVYDTVTLKDHGWSNSGTHEQQTESTAQAFQKMIELPQNLWKSLEQSGQSDIQKDGQDTEAVGGLSNAVLQFLAYGANRLN